MEFNLKEKLQNVSRKNVAIVTIILLVLTICASAGYEYYHYKQLEAQKQELFEKLTASANQTGEPQKPSEYKIGIEYNKAMKSKKPVLVLFYADWCGYCVKFMPIYQELSEKYADVMDFSKVNVEDKKYEKVVNEIGITGFPTVFILDPKYDNKVLLSNAYLGKTETVSKELDRYLRIRKLLDSKK